ncbi:MAG: hypothetical protein IKV11_01995 [Alphaproteobacteria bacterium]|nr:hypothetical protein [Alphaproteobacteria bacterium]
MKFDEKGRSMIEMLGVLAIIGVLSTAGIAGYSKAMGSYRGKKLADQVQLVTSNYIYYRENSNSREDMYKQDVINKILLPPEMVDKYGNCIHALHGRCQISRNSDGSDEFVIRFGDLDKDTCVYLLTLPYEGYTKRVSVNKIGPNTALSSGTGHRFTGQVSATDAAKYCEDEQNAIRWVY